MTRGHMIRSIIAALVAFVLLVAPASAARQIVDLKKLDAYFALFASDSNVPWKTTTVRLDTYSGTAVDFAVYQVDPGDVITAGSNARPRAIDTRGRRAVVRFHYSPPGGYHFQSNQVAVPLGNREGFFVVEARRGNVGEQVWINRTRIGLLSKETPGELALYGTDLANGRALAHMRIELLVNGRLETRSTDAHGAMHWNREPRPMFALAQWGESFAFLSLLPQAPLPNAIVGVRTDSAVVHAGDSVRLIGFARKRAGNVMRPASGNVNVMMRQAGTLVAQASVPLDAAGAFTATLSVPSNASSGEYAVLAQADGGVGSASVHVDANANGLSLSAAAQCDGACDARSAVPVQISASRGETAVRVTVVRSPHVFVGYTPETTPWGTTRWLDTTVRTGGDGRATIEIPRPTDGLASTYGVQVEAGGATADTRIVAPTARAAVRLHVDRATQTLGTPINFDVYVNDIGTGKPLEGGSVRAELAHGPSTQVQMLSLDKNGHARGAFSSPQLGMNLVFASIDVDGGRATDAGEVQVVPQATDDSSDNGSASAHIALDKNVYRAGDEIRVDAALPGAQGDAFVTLESALGVTTTIARAGGGRANAQVRAADALGNTRIGAAFVRDGAIDWTSVPLSLDATGRPAFVPLGVDGTAFSPGATTTVTLRDERPGTGTVVVRLSRGTPSGSALFDSAPALLSVGLAATQVSAPSGTTWHPWVDSTGEHAQVLGFERRGGPPPDLTLAEADTQAVSWNVSRADGATIPVQLPSARGRYTLSVLKISDDGRVTAASSTIVVQ